MTPSCEYNYYTSPEFLKLTFHTITCFAIPIHTFGFYCIIWETPSHMSSVKTLLLNLHSWCVALDLVISFLGIPYLLFPAVAGYGLGIVEAPGLFIYLGVTFITGVSTSVFVLFESRYFLLFGENTCWKHVRVYAIVFSYILVPLYFLPPQLMLPEQERGREISWTMLDCIPSLPSDNRLLFVVATERTLVAICVAIAEVVPCVEVATFFFLNCFHLMFTKRPSRMSSKTIKLQRVLMISLFIQSSVTFVLFLVPVNATIFFIVFQYQNQFFNNLIVFSFSFHGIASTLIMVIAHRPYREFALTSILRLVRKPSAVTVVSPIPSIRGVSTSVFVLFENRYYTLFGRNSFWKHLRTYAIGFSYILVPLYFLPPQFVLPDQELGREFWWKYLPCIPELPNDNRQLFVLATELPLVAVCMGIAEGIPTIQCGTFLFLNCFHLVLAKKPSGISRKTVKLQHKLVISLIIQTSVTIVLFLAPVNAIILFIAFEYQNQFHNNLIVFALAIHGIASTIIMVIAHKPYRDFAISPIMRFYKKTGATIVVSSIPSMRSTVES